MAVAGEVLVSGEVALSGNETVIRVLKQQDKQHQQDKKKKQKEQYQEVCSISKVAGEVVLEVATV